MLTLSVGAIIIGLFLFAFVRLPERRIYPCRLCEIGCHWNGSTWVHADGRLEAVTEPHHLNTHPAVPILL